MLELLVDHMAADGGALALEEQLTRGLAMVDHLVASGDLVGARHELETLLATARIEAAHAAALRRRLDELRAELRRAWCVCASDVGEQAAHHDLVGELLGRLPHAEGSLRGAIASADPPHGRGPAPGRRST